MKTLDPNDKSKPRSRRLRKKLRIEEFQQLGFGFEATVNSGFDEICIINQLVEYVESMGWEFGGGVNESRASGFLSHEGRSSLTNDDREAFKKWLTAQVWCGEATVHPLRDCWHGW